MGGQACVFYGAAQFSKDVDLALLAEEENFTRLRAALDELQAVRIAVPRFDPALLARGHAVHFRCRHPSAAGLRVDVMTRLRDLPEFAILWARRTTIAEEGADTFELMAVEDLVQAKKTQRSKDWPMIEALVEGHYHAVGTEPTSGRIRFWLVEARGPERLVELARRFSAEARAQASRRPLLTLAIAGNLAALRPALDAEMRAEQDKDRAYWEPLKRELESLRLAEVRERSGRNAD
ncbi:MAG: hypothetical protein HY735_30050 [Verrucomicrobia bacterium]|nr:hypothetical protein [Verrucomicrobiota bacterium]